MMSPSRHLPVVGGLLGSKFGISGFRMGSAQLIQGLSFKKKPDNTIFTCPFWQVPWKTFAQDVPDEEKKVTVSAQVARTCVDDF